MTRAFRPASLEEAVGLLADDDLQAVAVAGCTDLLVVDTATGRQHTAVVDLLGLQELKGIHVEDEWIDIGAGESFAAIRRHPGIVRHLPILAEVAGTIGAWQIQNRATIGGNIGNASPIGDSLPVLLALGAELVLGGPAGTRTLPYDAMHTGYRTTALQRGELVVRVRLPIPAPTSLQLFKKVGTRAAQTISKVVVALAARRAGERLVDVRLAAGGVAAIPLRLRSTEAICEDATVDSALAARAAEAARTEVTPIDDVRSTARYRSFVLGRIVRRMVLAAAPDPGAAG